MADAGPRSMDLVAAAWLSTSRVHVVFQPISGITRYRVLADSEQSQWSFSEEVVALPCVWLVCGYVDVCVFGLSVSLSMRL